MNLERYTHEITERLTLGSRGVGHGAHLFVVLAWGLDQPVNCVTEVLEGMAGVEWGDSGDVTGYVVTLREAAHAFRVEEHGLHTWCAFGALFISALIERSTHVVSTCAATRERILLTVTPSQIEAMQPADTAVSLILPQRDTPNIHDAFCRNVRFFASTATDRHWGRRATRATRQALSAPDRVPAPPQGGQRLLSSGSLEAVCRQPSTITMQGAVRT